MRIGVIHVTQRPDSWGHYYAWELRRNHPEHEVVYCAEPIGSYPQCRWRNPDCHAYLRIDDSLGYEVPLSYRPLIYLCSDTHVPDGVNRSRLAALSDFVFHAQKNTPLATGYPDKTEWLSHRAYYFPEPAEYPRWLVSAAMVLVKDSTLFGHRTRLAKRLRAAVGDLALISRGPMHGGMANLYANSLIVWNHSVNNDLNMRIFEGAAAGALVVSSRIVDNGMEDIFGDLIPQYEPNDGDECVDLIRNWLDRPKECRERGRALREIVQAKYSYAHALARILEKAEELFRA